MLLSDARRSRFLFYLSSLRFRVAFLSAILFLLSSLISFAALYWTGKENAFAALDQTLSERSREILCVYLTGSRRRSLGMDMPAEELPFPIQESLWQKYPTFDVLLHFRKEVPMRGEPGKRRIFYSIAGNMGEHFHLCALDEEGNLVSSRLLNPRKNLPEVRRLLQGWKYSGPNTSFFYRILAPENRVLAGAASREAERAFRDKKHFRTNKLFLNNGDMIQCAISLKDYREEENKLFSAILFIFLTLLPLSCGAGWLFAALLTRGVGKIRDASVKIASGDLSQRVREEEAPGSELKDLVSAFNTMSDNNEKLISELRSVTDDIAHDLRTPITRIRGNAELAVMKCANPDCREAFSNIAEECENMILLISDMLEITRSEGGVRHLNKEDFSLSLLMRELFENYLPTAEENGQIWTLSLPEKEILFHADPLKIQRILTNLLDNAIKFLPEKGSFILALAEEEEKILITASDTGPGIPDAYKEKVFKRFFRMDSSRSTKGNGLGLAMVWALVHQHNGSITLLDTPCAPSGATFRIHFPKEKREGF